MPTLLGIDFSSSNASICIYKKNQFIYNKEYIETRTHSETLLVYLNEAFEQNQLTPQQVDIYTITNGPGSFTGLRIGMSIVKGLCFQNKSTVLPVSTLEAMALGCEQTGLIISTIDARRGDVYWAAFKCIHKGHVTRLCADQVSSPARIADFLGEDINKAFFIGDGADICTTFFQEKMALPVYSKNLQIAKGTVYAGIELLKNNHSPMLAKNIFPNYIRLSQAEQERINKLHQNTF